MKKVLFASKSWKYWFLSILWFFAPRRNWLHLGYTLICSQTHFWDLVKSWILLFSCSHSCSLAKNDFVWDVSMFVRILYVNAHVLHFPPNHSNSLLKLMLFNGNPPKCTFPVKSWEFWFWHQITILTLKFTFWCQNAILRKMRFDPLKIINIPNGILMVGAGGPQMVPKSTFCTKIIFCTRIFEISTFPCIYDILWHFAPFGPPARKRCFPCRLLMVLGPKITKSHFWCPQTGIGANHENTGNWWNFSKNLLFAFWWNSTKN